MLLELHVRNLALIEKADLEFEEGLSILSGETGAGKSILIDSISLALGGKAGRDAIRSGAEFAYVELIFSVTGKERLAQLEKMDIKPAEDNTLIISRKLFPGRSVMRVNDETVTAARLRELTGLLIDIHGQHEHQSLLHPSMHLKFIDLLSPKSDEIASLKDSIKEAVSRMSKIEDMLREGQNEGMRAREEEILNFEINEIEDADLKEGEEEELHANYTRMRNASRIRENLGSAKQSLDSDEIARAVRLICDSVALDKSLGPLAQQMSELDGLMEDAKRSVDDALDDLDFDDGTFADIERRLDKIHGLQDKYGNDVNFIMKVCEEKKERVAFLEHYEEKLAMVTKEKEELEEKLEDLCSSLTSLRKESASLLGERIADQLRSLNFLDVRFDIEITKLSEFTQTGRDAAQFMISTNPGQPIKPLKDVASGGELSRIMLALKTVLADTDEIETLIFDEIDAGISGRTAQKVSEKLSIIGRNHQVLCITHLPQIAAMADHHYLIHKETDGMSTRTVIEQIYGEDITMELARLIGGSQITPAVLKTAGELKDLANEMK